MRTIKLSEIPESSDPSAATDVLQRFQDRDGVKRMQAREALERMGREATPALIRLLFHPRSYVRWEAAKALKTIGDPLAIPALIQALEDDHFEVRWLAAEALAGLGEAVIVPLLRVLSSSSDSSGLREGAHHVLWLLRESNHIPDAQVLQVLKTLGSMGAAFFTREAAKRALESLAEEDEWKVFYNEHRRILGEEKRTAA